MKKSYKNYKIIAKKGLSILIASSVLAVSSGTEVFAVEDEIYAPVLEEDTTNDSNASLYVDDEIDTSIGESSADTSDFQDDNLIEEEFVTSEDVTPAEEDETSANMDAIADDSVINSEEIDYEDVLLINDDELTADDELPEIESEQITDVEEENSVAEAEELVDDSTADNDLDIMGGDLPYVAEVNIDSLLEYGDGTGSEPEIAFCDAATLPSKYVPDYDAIPCLRNQGSTNMCWAFSSLFMAESSMLKKGLVTKLVDYAELALAFFMVHPVVDPLHLTSGDSNVDGPGHDFYTRGGNTIYSAMLLANWVGAANDEGEIAFSNRDSVRSSNYIAEEYAYNHDVAVLVGNREFDISTRSTTSASGYNSDEYILANRNAAKQLIKENGAISASMYAADYGMYYNSENNAYYLPLTGKGTGHSITIVGWDDNFACSKFNFYAKYGYPIDNGAWLIRNTYYKGTTEEFDGYFWMSYYDGSLSNSRAFIFDDASKYDNNYHYDGGVVSKEISNDGEITAANVFVASSSEAAEIIKTASFDTPTTNLQYSIDVYRNPEEGNPSSGEKIAAAHVSGSTTYAGYYTVPLGCDVLVEHGDKFAIVVKLSKPGATVAINRERSTSSTSWLVSTVAANSGESYYKIGTKWVDAGEQYNANVRIKAFAVNASDVYTIRYDANGGKGSVSDDINKTGAPFVLKDNKFTRTSYRFVGWNTKADGKGNTYMPGEVVNLELSSGEELNLYAVWQPIGWVKDSKGYRYYNSDGKYLKSCWQKISGSWYRFDKNGYRITGWKYIGGAWYYLATNGKMQTGWVKVDNTWYYLNGNGVMQTGWVSVGGKWYYLNSSGKMQTGWVKVGNAWYYLNGNGVMQIGWVSVGGKWYYLNSNGKMLTGWVYVDGKWYYLNSNGVMQTGWVYVSGKYYYLYTNGSMAINTWIGNYYVNEKGEWTKTR